MKLDPDCVLIAAEGAASRPLPEPGWRVVVPLLAAASLAILAIYWGTASSIVAIWSRSETFAHGYFVVPIACVLIWMRRRQLAAVAPRPDFVGFLLLAGCGLTWLAAEAAQVQVMRQYALAAMFPATVIAVAGRRAARTIAFPLAFLLLAVPFGEAFLPRLMEWTADFTVAALRASAIPVYREGTFFAIPSGQWSVVEACSGLRYLIASVTVGALYAYLTYRHWYKRAAFIVLSIAVPIGANLVRAYMIVMIGHLSGMKLAVGIDHLLYGWLFFGVVIGLLFWIGSFWRDPAAPAAEDNRIHPMHQASRPALAGAALAAVALASGWPLYAQHLDRVEAAPVALAMPAAVADWSAEARPALEWRPHFPGASASALAVYRNGERSVALYLAHYRNQRHGAELVSSQNHVAGGKEPPWSSVDEAIRTEERLTMRQTRLRSAGQRLLVWDWYRIGEHDVSNPYVAKALLARDKLLGRRDDSTAIVLAAPYDGRPESAAQTLRLFLRDARPAIEQALVDARVSAR